MMAVTLPYIIVTTIAGLVVLGVWLDIIVQFRKIERQERQIAKLQQALAFECQCEAKSLIEDSKPHLLTDYPGTFRANR